MRKAEPLKQIHKEHQELLFLLKKFEEIIQKGEDKEKIKFFLNNFGRFWNDHEKYEESFFEWFEQNSGKPFPLKKTLLEEHRILKGHWKIIQDSLKTNNEQKIETALETDGKMLLNKFIKHIEIEEDFLRDIEK